MTRTQQLLIAAGALVIAGLLAFPLRETIYRVIVVPAAFIIWNLELVYRSFSQGMWWWAIIFFVLVLLAFSMVPRSAPRQRELPKSAPPQGQVEGLAIWMKKAEKGIYFKWLVANRLGKLAYQMLLHRESGRPRSVFTPLLGVDWKPSQNVQQYLEIGLHGSFTDYPSSGPRAAPRHTPLDLHVSEAIEFLETQLDNGHSPQRH